MLTLVVLSFVVQLNENGICDKFDVQQRDNWDRNENSQEAVHQDHDSILYLQDEVV
jgi:hypothetical protein